VASTRSHVVIKRLRSVALLKCLPHDFETFPFPEPTNEQREAIAVAARELDRLRTNWLNPPEWTRTEILEFPGSVDGPWARYIDKVAPSGPDGVAAEATSPPAQTSARQRSQTPPLPSEGLAGRHLSNEGLAGLHTVRYPRLVPKDEECAKELKKRTLTNLYNQRPAWLELAHQKLDAAVFAAYGWPAKLSDDDLLAKLLELNLARAQQ
jgi:hypothetical protein